VQALDAANSLDLDGWIRGLLSAGISGGASAITGGIVVTGVDPQHYNFQAGKFWILVGTLFVVNAVVSMAKFLQAHPIPEVKTVTTTVEVTEQGKMAPKTVTTVEETHKEAK
jgi:hypothetical protein